MQNFRLQPNPQELASVGGGLRAAYGDHGRIDVTFAKALQRVADGRATNGALILRKPDARLLVSLTTRLLPW